LTPLQVEWARCRPWIESALPYAGGTHDIEDIEKAIAAGSMIFLPGKHCAVVLEVVIHPNFKTLNVFAGGGEKGGKTVREYCDEMDKFIVHIAREMGCKWVSHFCRPGGERVGKKIGYRKLSTVMIKEI
jgi:hypothetical protein